ncbi:SGNH/GDSL hydrolase family protein [Kitasatospora sp. NPDC092948]|uniref:SGNH/GDSL hydrolase family protein n=1 Tax=Kitasatospora sp. NPDC092948 TaxID=3364088 RepID=UPI0038297528
MSRTLSRLAVAATAVVLAAGLAVPSTADARDRAGALRWVALGDSYTAGVIQATGDVFETPPDGCARTTQSYPEIARRDLGARVDLRNVSCGAATIDNVYREQQTPLGRPMPPDAIDPNAPFAPVPPQLDAVGPKTDLVTIGIGGNTMGFAEIIQRCVELGDRSKNTGTPCKDEFTPSMSVRLDTVRQQYDQMLTALHSKAPTAKVITVGYPHIVPNDTASCRFGDIQQLHTITAGDLDWARTAVLEPLNKVIQQVSAAHGATYVDQYASSAGHSVCDSDHWVDGVVSSIVPLQFAFVHPNAKGQANVARLVENAIHAG